MRQWIRSHLTYANVMVTILAFVVLGGGSAVALNGSNTVQSDDLGPGAQVKAADVADNAVVSSDIKNGEVSVRDTNKVIPSGSTVTGAFRSYEAGDTNNPSASTLIYIDADFNGLRAPTPLTNADVNFDNEGISAAAAENQDEDPGCTGGIGIPTAPPGNVCIYLFQAEVGANSAQALRLGANAGFDQADDKGFFIEAASSQNASLGGTWAYTAP